MCASFIPSRLMSSLRVLLNQLATSASVSGPSPAAPPLHACIFLLGDTGAGAGLGAIPSLPADGALISLPLPRRLSRREEGLLLLSLCALRAAPHLLRRARSTLRKSSEIVCAMQRSIGWVGSSPHAMALSLVVERDRRQAVREREG